MIIDKLNISSNLKNINEVEHLVDRVCSSMSLGDEVYGDILISLTEAFNNAVMHGNKYEESKAVQIDVEKLEDKISFSVLDQGIGFDYHNLPDPTSPENLENECGRGIFLIRNLADEVEFNEVGNQIIIGFKYND